MYVIFLHFSRSVPLCIYHFIFIFHIEREACAIYLAGFSVQTEACAYYCTGFSIGSSIDACPNAHCTAHTAATLSYSTTRANDELLDS